MQALVERDGTLYVGTLASKVFRSADGGVSWQAASTGLPHTSVEALLMDMRDGTLYAGTWPLQICRFVDPYR